MPPSPVVVEWTVVQFALSGEVWIWYARANAASQFSRTRLIDRAAPRSTDIHCGSA